MTKFERKIMQDVHIGTELLEKGTDDEIELYLETIEGKYVDYISGLKGLHVRESYKVGLTSRTWKDVLKMAIDILETGKEFIQKDNSGRPITLSPVPKGAININNQANSSNHNTLNNENTNEVNITVNIKELIQNAKDKIVDEFDGVLSDEDIQKALLTLDELENISELEESKSKKWSKMKGVFSWLSTQGVGIFTTVTPIILKILENQ